MTEIWRRVYELRDYEYMNTRIWVNTYRRWQFKCHHCPIKEVYTFFFLVAGSLMKIFNTIRLRKLLIRNRRENYFECAQWLETRKKISKTGPHHFPETSFCWSSMSNRHIGDVHDRWGRCEWFDHVVCKKGNRQLSHMTSC